MMLPGLVVGCYAQFTYADDRPAGGCADCHVEQAAELVRSVHEALSCQECHGGASSYPVSGEEVASYAGAGRGAATFDHGVEFTGKAKRAEVPNLCGECHANVERMNPFGLRTDQLARYRTSGHGKTLATRGNDRVAVCTDCHGAHEIRHGRDPESRTYPLNVPDTCAVCHADAELMEEFGHSPAQVEEYRDSVHGELLFEHHDTGAPTCASCHGNHSAIPPGFATVGAVCGQCHQHAAKAFSTSVHASLPEHKGCVQCHGGGAGKHFHHIQRITKPPGIMIQRYAELLVTEPRPTTARVTAAIHPDPKRIVEQALPTCMDCHEELEDDESLPKLFNLLDEIAKAEEYYVRTGNRLSEVEKGVLLVDSQKFKFQDAKTHLIGLAPLQHTLNNSLVAEAVAELNGVCDEIHAELDSLENGLRWRHRLLIPIWLFAVFFGTALYVKFKQLKRRYVVPLPPSVRGRS